MNRIWDFYADAEFLRPLTHAANVYGNRCFSAGTNCLLVPHCLNISTVFTGSTMLSQHHLSTHLDISKTHCCISINSIISNTYLLTYLTIAINHLTLTIIRLNINKIPSSMELNNAFSYEKTLEYSDEHIRQSYKIPVSRVWVASSYDVFQLITLDQPLSTLKNKRQIIFHILDEHLAQQWPQIGYHNKLVSEWNCILLCSNIFT